jgi:hypothetical protein
MDPVLIALGGAAVVAGTVRLYHRLQQRRGDRRDAEAELAAITHLAEADAVLFGEELSRLGTRVADAELDEDTRADYQSALDSYETAGRVVDRLRTIDDVSEVVDALAAGRYAVACVLARVEGTPLPAFRVPCFFDPRHGPASTEVMWTAPGHGTRKVPACAQDAERHERGAEPDVTMVRVNGCEVPYWAAGGLHQPYENGYVPRTAREATLDQRAEPCCSTTPTSSSAASEVLEGRGNPSEPHDRRPGAHK